MERIPLISITRCFRTTSTTALHVLAGILPLDLTAKLETRLSNIYFHKEEDSEYVTIPKLHTMHPAEIIIIHFNYNKPIGKGIEIYTDRFKFMAQNGSRTGCAYIVYSDSHEVESHTFKLSDFATMFQAELWAHSLSGNISS